MLKAQLHCGACMKNFDDNDELSEHLKSCRVAKTLLIPALRLMFGNDSMGHTASRLFHDAWKHQNLIERYAACISYEMSNMERMKIHAELCEKLGLDHAKFKPFEADDIDSLPSVDQAKQIIWSAIEKELETRFNGGPQ